MPAERSIWFQAKHFNPPEVGWYECNMDAGGWTFGNGCFCFWDGKSWIRPSGWPAEKSGTFQLDESGILQVDKRGLFEFVTVLEFRGLQEPTREPYDKSWAVPRDRIWDKKHNRLMFGSA